jgi:hypothetical protein
MSKWILVALVATTVPVDAFAAGGKGSGPWGWNRCFRGRDRVGSNQSSEGGTGKQRNQSRNRGGSSGGGRVSGYHPQPRRGLTHRPAVLSFRVVCERA